MPKPTKERIVELENDVKYLQDKLHEYQAIIPDLVEANALIKGVEAVKEMIEKGLEAEDGETLCAYCAHPFHNMLEAREHAQQCPANPLVVRILFLETELDAAKEVRQ